MNKEVISKIFEETLAEMQNSECDENRFMEKISHYIGEDGRIDFNNAIVFSYIEGFKTSAEYMLEVMDKVLNSEEFKQAIFQDVMDKAQEEYHRTNTNPFDM